MPENSLESLQIEVKQAVGFANAVRAELGKVVCGQDRLVDRLLVALITNGHLLVEGVPGLAKTLAISTLARCLGAEAGRVQFTPDLLPADIIGTQVYDPRSQTFSVKRGPVFCNLLLADEINRAPAKVQSALLEAMAERQVTLAGESLKLPDPFLVMATQNPLDQEGTYPLPEAQMDRFMMKVVISYPARSDEREMLTRMGHPVARPKASAVASLEDVITARSCVDRIYMDPRIAEYILDLVIATRPASRAELSEMQKNAKLDKLDTLISCGASPRATLALALAAKAHAFLRGRAHVIPQDVKEMAPDVLRHRIGMTYEAEAEGLDSSALIERLLNQLATP